MKEKIAERIRIARVSRNFSQQNMADELGLTVAAYSNIERGVTDISVTRLTQIAGLLDLNPKDFFKDEMTNAFGELINNDNQSLNLISQQLYMLIQQVQQLQDRLEKIEQK
ncbi:MAG: helix-turn-helix domain-containing protein [Bacteroidota bacterium]